MKIWGKHRYSVVFIVICLWIVGTAPQLFGASANGVPIPDAKHTLVIGKVSTNPKKHYKYLKPMVDYMVRHLRDLGITRGRVLMAKDNEEMIRYLQSGQVDWVTETPFSALIYAQKTGAEILLRKWKKGVPEYHTVFITHQDSSIHSLADLTGKALAFEDPGSTSGYFVPKGVLLQEGFVLYPLLTPREKPPADKVGYAFAHAEINMATWVYRRLVDAAAYSNLDWERDSRTPKEFKKSLRIFHRTRPFPRAVEVARQGLDPRLKARLKAMLLNAHNTPEGKAVLKAYQETTKFDEFTSATRHDLQEVSRILHALEAATKP